jgi:hypothetical protein
MGNDRGLARVYGITRRIMANSIFNFLSRLDRFERWFNDRFGWFFTNGMKGDAALKDARRRSSLR